jgi:hypothetical protein
MSLYCLRWVILLRPLLRTTSWAKVTYVAVLNLKKPKKLGGCWVKQLASPLVVLFPISYSVPTIVDLISMVYLDVKAVCDIHWLALP